MTNGIICRDYYGGSGAYVCAAEDFKVASVAVYYPLGDGEAQAGAAGFAGAGLV